jgi:ADP-ribosylglycohydrolase
MDRAVGAVIGMAVGDALGAGYEFQPARHDIEQIDMIGGGLGPFEPAEWTDDTSMAIPMLQALAAGHDLLAVEVQDSVARSWVDWMQEAPDVGTTISAVLHQSQRPVSGTSLTEAAHAMFSAGRRAAGNGSLMRTTPIVLGYLGDPKGLARAARTYSDMTHGDPDAGDACVLWNFAQRHAILRGEFDLLQGIQHLPPARRQMWRTRIEGACEARPREFAAQSGWVVAALQAAWAGICSAPGSGPEHFDIALREVVAAGGDADTVAAIAGSLLGARWGVSAIALRWRRLLHGWPGFTDQGLVRLAVAAVSAQPWPDYFYSPVEHGSSPVQHPDDAGVWLGDVAALPRLPDGVDAVVSLCRVGASEGPPNIDTRDHVYVWLIDSHDNPHLDFVAQQAVDAICELRAAGKRVFVHCVHAHSRTPFIAALYAMRITEKTAAEALADVLAVLPGADPNPWFRAYLDEQ